MISKLDTEIHGSTVMIPLTQFNELIKKYTELKQDCKEKDKVIDYLNKEIAQYNDRFVDE